MREDLSTAIDDHMSGNNASGRSLIAPIFEENGKFAKGIEIEPVDNKLKTATYPPLPTLRYFSPLVSTQP
jgi:hypothetical protein